ncbi:MAG: MmcQ/YjbR family DNA-binding protein [Pyrinomonadaceae bacterium]
MTPNEFRQLALSFPKTEERSHMDHPDFRVGGKIFATIAPDGERGMVKLTPEQQALLTRTEPSAFEPASGAWGRNGSTMVTFANADETTVRQALSAAWKNTAPKKLIKDFGSL